MFLINSPSLLYVFKKWSEFTLKVVRVYLKSGTSLLVFERWREGCILPFPKKGNLSLTKNYRGLTLTSIAAKIFNLMILNRIRPEIDPILRKNQNGLRKNRSTSGQILTIRRILEGVKSKNLPLTL